MPVMTTPPEPPGDGVGKRKELGQGMLAALWTVSNGRCYAPGCPVPVVLETRPGIYQKNSEAAHIYGVRPGAARYRPNMSTNERDSFANVLLLCQAHHTDVDGKATRHLFPPELLKKWKQQHEGAAGSVLNRLLTPDTDLLMKKLMKIAEPPLERLEDITRRLKETGTVTSDTVAELKQVISALSISQVGVDARTANSLSFAAEILGNSRFDSTVQRLSHAAEVLPALAKRVESAVKRAQQSY